MPYQIDKIVLVEAKGQEHLLPVVTMGSGRTFLVPPLAFQASHPRHAQAKREQHSQRWFAKTNIVRKNHPYLEHTLPRPWKMFVPDFWNESGIVLYSKCMDICSTPRWPQWCSISIINFQLCFNFLLQCISIENLTVHLYRFRNIHNIFHVFMDHRGLNKYQGAKWLESLFWYYSWKHIG